MEQKKKLPVGVEGFEKIREQGIYYVDKTGLIKDLLEHWGEVNLFTRPGRFGNGMRSAWHFGMASHRIEICRAGRPGSRM